MMEIKQFIKRTPLYRVIREFRLKKSLAQWTALDQKIFDFYIQFVCPGDVCFDVGANVGNRTKVLLKLGAKVVAVEPQDECVRIIKSIYGRSEDLNVIQKVLGASDGQTELMVSNANTISSLSIEWIEAVKRSGRFSAYTWDKKQNVEMITLDGLIGQYGVPSFIKIDVEGFEYEVLKGLSQPIKTISLEFTPEFIQSTLKCLDHLRSIGDIRLNYSIAESMRFQADRWMSYQEMVQVMTDLKVDNQLMGDVYIQFL